MPPQSSEELTQALLDHVRREHVEATLRALDVSMMLAERPGPNPGVVYVAHAVGTSFVKVGWTEQAPFRESMISAAWSRIRQWATGCPFELKLLYVCEGSPAMEKEWHRQLEPTRMQGEWFDLSRLSASSTLASIRVMRRPAKCSSTATC